jgi:formamidopyrimidine-DNA glycosylase
MPELPEVEILCRRLDEHCGGRRVERAELASISALKTFDPPLRSLVGHEIKSCSRRGKYICFQLTHPAGGLSPPRAGTPSPAGRDLPAVASPGSSEEFLSPGTAARDSAGGPLWLVIHLGRGGWIKWRRQLAPAAARPGRGPLALRLGLEGGDGFDVTEMGTEKRLAIWVVTSPEEVPGVATLGPEPLDADFTLERLAVILQAENGDLKHVLSRQSVIAGVGNAYSDEALHAARLSPFKQAARLSPDELGRLHAALNLVLTEAVDRAAPLDLDELKDGKRQGMRVHGRTGSACPVCGDTVREVSFATRSLQYCATCQTGGKPLADRRLSRLLK